jgi:Protein of unknown function (DUF3060)
MSVLKEDGRTAVRLIPSDSTLSWYKGMRDLVLTFGASHDIFIRSKRACLRGDLWLAWPKHVSRIGSDEEAWRRSDICGASFIGSGQTTTLNCAGGGAHILGSNNTLTLTGACKWLDMVGSNNTLIVAFGNGANIEFAGSNNAITWTSADGKEPVVRHVGSGNTLTAGR